MLAIFAYDKEEEEERKRINNEKNIALEKEEDKNL